MPPAASAISIIWWRVSAKAMTAVLAASIFHFGELLAVKPRTTWSAPAADAARSDDPVPEVQT
jgi:hypothetical protein